MSRKKVIKTGVAATLPNISKTVFKSTTQRIPDESDATQIARAVREAASQKAERELLEQELAKPSAARNPALMRKFGTANLQGSVDKYPDLSKGEKYRILITIPDDPNIPLEHRPTVWSVTVVIHHDGNEFNFVFPLSRANQVDPSIAYKLDNFPVFLDADYNVVIEATEDYDLYEALLDWKNGDETYLWDRRQVFKFYGIDLGSGKLDFRVRGRGFYVTYTRLKVAKVKQSVKKEEVTKKGEARKVINNVGEVIIHYDAEYMGDPVKGALAADAVAKMKSVTLLGLDPKDIVEDLYITDVYSNSRLNTPIVVLDMVIDGSVYGIIINGLSAAQSLLGKSGTQKVTQEALNKWVIAKNRKVFAEYIALKQ